MRPPGAAPRRFRALPGANGRGLPDFARAAILGGVSPAPLRLMVFDKTCHGRGPLPGLTASWKVGARLYRALGRLDASLGVSTWDEALEWLASFRPEATLAEIQFWGHGKWGCAMVDRKALEVSALSPGHPFHARLAAIRERLVPGGEALWWFRTCETFGGPEGHAFARAWTRFFGCRAAGHTYVIGPWQSGLHSLAPGEEPSWSTEEGLVLDASGKRRATALFSGPAAPNTITCFHGAVPDGF